jgi:hypothetical protein
VLPDGRKLWLEGLPGEGTPVRVAFRTQSVTVEPKRHPKVNELLAEVKSVSYMGDRLEYLLRAADAEFTVEADRALAAEGDSLLVKIDPAAAKVWPR